MTRAIYKQREDGDYDFVAAFDAETATQNDWVEQVQEWLENEGEDVLIVNNCDLQFLPDVWDGTARNLRQFRIKPLKHEKRERRFVAVKSQGDSQS